MSSKYVPARVYVHGRNHTVACRLRCRLHSSNQYHIRVVQHGGRVPESRRGLGKVEEQRRGCLQEQSMCHACKVFSTGVARTTYARIREAFDLTCAYLTCAYLTCAYLTCAYSICAHVPIQHVPVIHALPINLLTRFAAAVVNRGYE